MHCGPFFERAGTVRVHLERGRVERKSFKLDPHDLLGVQFFKNAVEHARLRPPVHARVDGVPVAKLIGQPHHLHPCSAMYNTAFNNCRFDKLTLPRCTGKLSLIRAYCSSVISTCKP